MNQFNLSDAKAYINRRWRDEIVKCVTQIFGYSPDFPAVDGPQNLWDPLRCLKDLVPIHEIPGMLISIECIDGFDPVIFIEIPGTKPEAGTVFLYGHGHKQPSCEKMVPCLRVIDGDKLYHRGGVDDDYALFSMFTAISTLVNQGVPYARHVVIIEFAEKPGSPGLEQYIKKLKDRIGDVSLTVCLGSKVRDYNRLWNAPSLSPWLQSALTEASIAFFGNDFESVGEGGSIPFIKMLGDMFPEAQFVVTGLLGNDAVAHGPNEYLHLPAVKNLTGCVAQVLAAHAAR